MARVDWATLPSSLIEDMVAVLLHHLYDNARHIDGKGGLGFTTGIATIALQEEPGPVTLMTYSSDVQIGGKIAGVGQRLLESVGKMMTKQALDALNKELQARL